MGTGQTTRRIFLQQSGALLGALATPVLLTGCKKKELTCTDTGSLTSQEQQTRQQLAYVDRSPDAAKTCDGCRFFQPASPDQCGTCQLVKGPIHPKGNCKSWSAKI